MAPSVHNQTIPPALDALILRLLAKSPEERPESAEVVREELGVIGAAPAILRESTVSHTGYSLDRLAGDIFVGREREMDILREHLEEALAGHGRSVVVLGEPGIGKTRTAMEVATYARLRGAQVLIGQCHEDEGAPPYWPLVQVVRAYLGEYGLAALQTKMGPGITDIAEAPSEVREYVPNLPKPLPLEPEYARFRFFDSYTQFLKNIARNRPVVFLLDDVQWADIPSLLFVQFLAQSLGETPLLLLATCREGESQQRPALTQTLAASARTPGSQMLHLQGLTDHAVIRFIELTTGRPPTEALAAAIFRETEGHPFFMTEVVRLLATEESQPTVGSPKSPATTPSPSLPILTPQSSLSLYLPHTVRSVIERRLAQVSDPCRHMLVIASVIGREFGLKALETVRISSPLLGQWH